MVKTVALESILHLLTRKQHLRVLPPGKFLRHKNILEGQILNFRLGLNASYAQFYFYEFS